MDVTSVWNLQGQLFALLAVGVLLRKIDLFEDATKRVLTDLVLFVTLPCSIVLSFQFSIDKQLIQSLVFTFLVSVGVYFFCFLLSRLFFRKVEKAQQSVLRYGLLVSNAGFMGLPIVGELFGSAGLMYASIYIIPLRVLMWTVGALHLQPGQYKQERCSFEGYPASKHGCHLSRPHPDVLPTPTSHLRRENALLHRRVYHSYFHDAHRSPFD
jgi:hypothetical protein